MAATQENSGGFPAHWSGRIAKWEFSLFLDNVTRQTVEDEKAAGGTIAARGFDPGLTCAMEPSSASMPVKS